jgi:hypothetical protein
MAAARRMQTLEDVCLAGQVAASANFKKNVLAEKSNWKRRPEKNSANWKKEQGRMARMISKVPFMKKTQLNFHLMPPRASMINSGVKKHPCL